MRAQEQLQQFDDEQEQLIRNLRNSVRQLQEENEIMGMTVKSCQREIREKNIIIRQQKEAISTHDETVMALQAENHRLRLQVQTLKNEIRNLKVSGDSAQRPSLQSICHFQSSTGLLSRNRSHHNVLASASNTQNKRVMTPSSQNILMNIDCKKYLNRKPTIPRSSHNTPHESAPEVQPIRLRNEINIFNSTAMSSAGFLPGKKSSGSRNKDASVILDEVRNTKNSFMSRPVNVGESLAEDFIVIGPDAYDLCVKKEQAGQQIVEMRLTPTILCRSPNRPDHNTDKSGHIREILNRSFPQNIYLRKQKDDNVLRATIERSLVDTLNNPKQEFYVFNLRGDEDCLNNPVALTSNPNKLLFIVCFRVPDFIAIQLGKRSSLRYQFWLTQRVIAVVSYYPFFESQLQFLLQLQKSLTLLKLKAFEQSKGKSLPYLGLDFSIKSFSSHDSLRKKRDSYINQKVTNELLYGNSIMLFSVGEDPFGFLPQKVDLALTGFASGMVSTNLAFEEFMYILTAILCEKIVIFNSRSAFLGSFTALTFVGLLKPFKYPHPIILNADQQKIQNLLFQSPLPLVASVCGNANDLITFLAEVSAQGDNPFHIVVDLDSNTILTDKNTRNTLDETVPTSIEKLRTLYEARNMCKPKSVFITKSMPVSEGVFGFTRGKKQQYQQQREREDIYKMEYQRFTQALKLNQSKLIDMKPYPQIVEEIKEFLTGFSRTGKRGKEEPRDRLIRVRRELMDEYPEHKKFLECFTETQIFSLNLDDH